jgi:cell wall-associated NlpC family hydrolase
MIIRIVFRLLPILSLLLLAGCGSAPPQPASSARIGESIRSAAGRDKANEVVLFSLGLLNIGYRFGGKNPEAGLDCSGMVSYVFRESVNLPLQGSAADLPKRGRAVDVAYIQPGDLVFFNTSNRPHSHVGIYIGEGRFIHAPSSKGKVRIDSLASGWFAQRFEEARNYFD